MISFFLIKIFSFFFIKKQYKWIKKSEKIQIKNLKNIILKANNTIFGLNFNFKKIKNYNNFKHCISLKKYKSLIFYIKKIKLSYQSVLWKNMPIYFAKTAGTTLGNKYIPITKESIHEQISSTRNTLLNYICITKNIGFLKGKMIFLSGSPKLMLFGNILTGRLSGIVNYHIPIYLNRNKLPSYSINCIENWYNKINEIVNITIDLDVTFLSGIPPWMQIYFDKLYLKKYKNIISLFPNFSLLVHGGVNFAPYKLNMINRIGKNIDFIETYAASESFIAFQNLKYNKGLLLQLNSNIFFEFISLSEYINNKLDRIYVKNIKLNVNYVIILSNNAGLWSYVLGDIIKFISTNPYKIIITGRINQFISTFGEHVISEEIEKSINYALNKSKEVLINDFIVVPFIADNQYLSCHEWLIEFIYFPKNLLNFINYIEFSLKKLNSYYCELNFGKILSSLKITCLKKNTFTSYMNIKGKLGNQNKIIRLSNNRKIANKLLFYNYFFN